MWVFTRHGFFSAVCARQENGNHHQRVDTGRIMVRARVKESLEALRDMLRLLLHSCFPGKSSCHDGL
jgi:hypothetical protein